MNILIIGVTSEVAQSIAKKYLAAGHSVFGLGRNLSRIEALEQEYPKTFQARSTGNMTDSKAFDEVIREALSSLSKLDIVLICQGYLPHQEETEKSFAGVQETFSVNTLTVIQALVLLVQNLKDKAPVKIGVITSVAGQRGRPRNFTYGAAKGAVSIYLQGLRSVHWKTGFEIYDFRLGPVDTVMTKDHEKNFSFTTADKAASLIMSSLSKRKYTCYIPGFWRYVMFLVRVMPEWLFQRLGFLSSR